MNMKKVGAIVLLTSIYFIFTPSKVFAWEDCPRGMINDPYPGECARYIDTDNDGICDHSQPAPEDRVGKIQEDQNDIKDVNHVEDTKQTSNKGPQEKIVSGVKLVVVNLVAILIYTTYRKIRVTKV